MKRLALAAAICMLCGTAGADVVRPAPNFQIEGVGKSLRSFKGQPVVLVVTRTARWKDFRKMVARLEELYPQFSNENVIFVVAIENGPEEVPSNIPFVLAANPQQVAADYGMTGKFGIAVIGVDGNVDMVTGKVIAAARVRSVIFNNFDTQESSRKFDRQLTTGGQ